MSRLQDISKMNLADLDRPGQTALEEDSMLEESTTPEGNADIDETGPEGPSAEESEEAASPVGKKSGTTAEKQENDSRKEEPKKMMEPSGEHYYVDVDIEESDLVSFMINHSYHQPMMILVTVIGIIWPFMAWYKGQNMIIPLIGAACILILMPFSTIRQAKKAKKVMPAYQEVFHYMFDEWGMHLELGGEAIDVEWKRVTKLAALKSLLAIYTGKNNAFLLPYKAMGARKEEITAFIYRMTGKRK